MYTNKIVAAWFVVISASKVGPICDNKETPDLLDEGSQQLRIWQPDDGNQDISKKEKTGHIYFRKRRVTRRREREHSRTDNKTKCLKKWGSSTRWKIYCNKIKCQRLRVTGRHWHRRLFTVRNKWIHWRGTEASGKGRAKKTDTSKECSKNF